MSKYHADKLKDATDALPSVCFIKQHRLMLRNIDPKDRGVRFRIEQVYEAFG